MRRRAAARARAAAVLLPLALAAGCRPRGDTLPTLWRIPLPAEAAGARTLGLDSAGRAWVGRPGGVVALDSAGRVAGRVAVRGDSVPRLLWQGPGTLALSAGRARLARADAAGGEARTGWESRALRAAAPDPRGRWVYAATRTGGVVGLDARTLAPRWGWPDAGAEATGIAVSTLADRVYVALGGDAETLQVRDAQSGRVLFSSPHGGSLRELHATLDGSVYGVLGGRVVRLRHARGELETLWTVSPGTGGRGSCGCGWTRRGRAWPSSARGGGCWCWSRCAAPPWGKRARRPSTPPGTAGGASGSWRRARCGWRAERPGLSAPGPRGRRSSSSAARRR